MDVAGSGHSVRGRRRGRPPGVRSNRTAINGSTGPRRQVTQRAKRKTRDSDLSDPDSTASESSASDVPSGQENKHAAGGRRGRGRPVTKKTAMSDHEGSNPAATLAATTGGVQSLVDPREFARRAGDNKDHELAHALDAYLRSFVTMPDESVFGSVGRQALARETQEEDGREAMLAEVQKWVDREAHMMHRVAVLRLRGLLRDTEPSPAFDGPPASDLGRLLPPALTPPATKPTRTSCAIPPATTTTTTTSWDILLRDICQRHREVTTSARRQRTESRRRSRKAALAGERRMAQRGEFRRPEVAERAERERKRRLAKWTVQQVMRRWAFVQSVVVDQRRAEEEERRRRCGRRQLLDMVERSTRMLAAQRGEESDGESEQEEESDSENVSDSEEESDEDAEIAQLQQDQDVPVDALLEQYRAMQADGSDSKQSSSSSSDGSGDEAASDDNTLPE
ncbi:hypothetical protein IW150_000443, partial [Coemansia sp. RSA 2607]